VTVDGRPLDDEARELAHGARIECEGLTILFGDLRSIGSTTRVAGVTDDELMLPAESTDGDVAGDTGGVLRAIRDGRSYPIPGDGLTIGRDPGCGLVLSSREVSRVHAMISTSLRGYTVADHGINGVLVNGQRVDGSRVLRRGDVVRIGDEEFRFDADPASFEPAEGLKAVAGRKRGAPAASPASPDGSAGTTHRPSRPPQPLVATLEVVTEGTLRGKRFRIESALAHIGRGDHNDVRLPDASVSGSHATLLHRVGTWHLTELGSTNGTYVDGDRIAGERAIRGAAEIRVGDIRLSFRPISAPPAPSTTRGIVGVTDEQARKARTNR
jgi:pSer/pThr/pTyr-binding forkhead associated (FHA) protein